MLAEKPTNQDTIAAPRAGMFSVKGRAKWLTFEYALAMGSLVMSILLSVWVIISLFKAWAGQASTALNLGHSWLAGMFDLSTHTTGTGLVIAGVAAVLLGVLALVCFNRVSREIPERSGYTGRVAYKAITYGGFAVLFVQAVALIAKLVAILVSSLLFIGISGAGSVYKSLYLGEFAPYLISLAIVGAGAMLIGKIISGVNKSKIASMVTLGVAAIVMIAACLTVAIQVRDSGERTIIDTPSLNDTPAGNIDDFRNPDSPTGNAPTGGININDLLKDLNSTPDSSSRQNQSSSGLGIPR